MIRSVLERGLGIGASVVPGYSPAPLTYAPLDLPPAGVSGSGIYVTADSALANSAVWAGVRILAGTIASLPLKVYRDRADGGQDVAPNHPVYDLLHDQPNEYQTALEFREQRMLHLLLRGNAYARILDGPRGAVDQLIPLHPDLVRQEWLDSKTVRYRVADWFSGRQELLPADAVFHTRGLSLDGRTGVSVITYARNSLGMAAAAESHGANFFANAARPSGVLSMPGQLKKGSQERLRDDWKRIHGAGSSEIAILEEGVTFAPIGLTNEDSQWLQSRQFGVEEVARWLVMPPHLLGSTDKSTTWGTGLEQQQLAFYALSLLPWLKREEASIKRQLIIGPQFFAQHVVEGLLRGDIKTRYAAYAVGIQWGWLSPNDVRRLEALNPIPEGDRYIQPLNMGPIGSPPPKSRQASPGGPPQLPGATAPAAAQADSPREMIRRLAASINLRHEGPGRVSYTNAPGNAAQFDELMALVREDGAHAGADGEGLVLFARDAAARVVRKELAAMTRVAQRVGGSMDGWVAGVEGFYADHHRYVAEMMRVDEDTARSYALGQMIALRDHGIGALDTDCQAAAVDELVLVALRTRRNGKGAEHAVANA